MKTVVLPASTSSDLQWSLDFPTEKFLIEFDFGWNQGPFFINESAAFHAFTLALDQYSKEVWPRIQDRCKGVILYRGSLSILTTLTVAEEELSPVEAATVFGDYLHRLASFLPEDVPVYCLFDDRAHFSKGEVAQILSQERFAHLHLSLDTEESPLGVLLPQDEQCTPEILKKLTRLLEETPTLRIIPERRLNELWNGLDELIVFEEAMTGQGKRQLLGFEAAGGKIRSRGI